MVPCTSFVIGPSQWVAQEMEHWFGDRKGSRVFSRTESQMRLMHDPLEGSTQAVVSSLRSQDIDKGIVRGPDFLRSSRFDPLNLPQSLTRIITYTDMNMACTQNYSHVNLALELKNKVSCVSVFTDPKIPGSLCKRKLALSYGKGDDFVFFVRHSAIDHDQGMRLREIQELFHRRFLGGDSPKDLSIFLENNLHLLPLISSTSENRQEISIPNL
ncbi:hypothetical protein VNO77_19944 [Canavalia gladiata]|uniref:Uncharacterized protein n=1 Tax=Canavalia gladiata TaxID=3824 RepID=A0AAN9QKY9_CANGL